LRKEDRPEKGAAGDFRFTEEQKMILEMAKGFAEKELKPRAAEIEATRTYPCRRSKPWPIWV